MQSMPEPEPMKALAGMETMEGVKAMEVINVVEGVKAVKTMKAVKPVEVLNAVMIKSAEIVTGNAPTEVSTAEMPVSMSADMAASLNSVATEPAAAVTATMTAAGAMLGLGGHGEGQHE